MVTPDEVHIAGFLILMCFQGQMRWAVFKSDRDYAWTLATVATSASPTVTVTVTAAPTVTSITPQRIPAWGKSIQATARFTSVILPGTETVIPYGQLNARNNWINYDAMKQRAPFHATWTVLTDPRTGMAVVADISISRNRLGKPYVYMSFR